MEIIESTSYVRNIGDSLLSRGNLVSVSTFSERIEWVLANCRRSDGAKWDAASLSHAAGISSAHVGMIRRGDVKSPRPETVIAIAKAAGVNSNWLLTGDGSADAIDTPSQDVGVRARPLFSSLSNWSALRESARALDPALPEWALDEVGQSHPLATVPITPRQVVQMARIALELLPPPDSKPSPK